MTQSVKYSDDRQQEYENTYQAENLMMKVMYFLSCLVVLAQVLQISGLVSILIAILYAATFVLFAVSWIYEFSILDAFAIVIVLLSFVHVFLNALASGSNVSFSYLRKWIMFSSTIVFFASAFKLVPDEKLLKEVRVGNVCLALFLMEEYVRQGRSVYYLNGIYTEYLIFHFTNPNLTALFLGTIAIFEVCRVYSCRGVQMKVLHAALAAVMIFFSAETQSRNILLVTTVFVILFLVLLIRKQRELKRSWLAALLVSVYPLFFSLIYLRTISWIKREGFLSFLVEKGKELSSRTNIWQTAFSQFRESPLLGAYYQMSGGTGLSQAHNTGVDILTSYGLIPFILVNVFLVQVMYRSGQAIARENFIYLAAFACCLLMGTGEAALFSGGLCIQIFVGTFLILANFGEKKEAEET